MATSAGSKAQIRRASAEPFYVQLADILRAGIQGGDYEPGDLLPSEADLGDFFGVSRTAVRQALDVLVADGLVLKQKGRGTIVTSTKVDELVVTELRGFHEEMTRRGAEVSTQLLRLEAEPVPPDVVGSLQLGPGDQVVVVERVRSVDGVPIVAVRTYLPYARFRELLLLDLTDAGLYETLAEEFDVRPRAGSRRFEAELAVEALAGALDVSPGAAILKLTAVNHDQAGAPFEHFVACYRADRAAFDVNVSAAGDARMDVHDPT